jgi:hypothetical protein
MSWGGPARSSDGTKAGASTVALPQRTKLTGPRVAGARDAQSPWPRCARREPGHPSGGVMKATRTHPEPLDLELSSTF